MRGKYEHGGIFEVTDKTAIPNNPEEKLDSNGKPYIDEEYIENLPKPNINAVKPGIPKYSFGPVDPKFDKPEELPDRFYSKTQYPRDKNKSDYILFENGKFAPDDTVGYRYKEWQQCYMGRSKKCKNLFPENNYPGPGMYKLKGFADEVREKGDKINEARLRIKEKEMRDKKLLDEKKNAKNNENKSGPLG
ncbi:MAG: hypothetical protein MJ252_26295 [archaeon]|nr:hypothetical protein [archaeon]